MTITGGKWTTYRQMGEDTVDQAALVGGLPERPSGTADAPPPRLDRGGPAAGGRGRPTARTRRPSRASPSEQPGWGEPLHPRLPYRVCEVVWAARHEMARTVEDVLARRTRALLLDARASLEAAPAVARLLAAELGRDEAWERRRWRRTRRWRGGTGWNALRDRPA